jgi:alkylation response protein AidB-like acyl-CoA dehydrogenase
MIAYQAPLRDLRFILHELLQIERLSDLPALTAGTRDSVDAVLEAAARYCERELLPLNAPGDRTGCRFEAGQVQTPEGFRAAYQRFCAAGWPGLACDPAHGGQGLPEAVNLALVEMVCSTNLAFGIYPALSHAAYLLLAAYGDEALRARYLPPLVEGRWAGTMCLTEPQCGTDLGLIRTRARPAPDATYRLTGAKIFISAGEHDLTENIVHLVLARLPDAPPGSRGLSLFVVPKFLPRSDGTPGERNGVVCTGIEAKMGLHASATCQLQFEEAIGWLLGQPNQGLRAMFTMMNVARLAVGIQGLGLAETALQSALAYAHERRQGHALDRPSQPEAAADPIIVHADIRRMLLRMRAFTEGARALILWMGQELDLSRHHADAERRREADDLVQLMTPIIKAFLTDEGFSTVNLGLQVFGGHGYIREHGMEQLVRDARIGQLYEGTNGIQALDLVGRKLATGYGRLLRRFFHPATAFLEAHHGQPAMEEFLRPFGAALGLLQEVTALLADRASRDQLEGSAAASDYLRLFGLVALGYMWVRMSERALAGKSDGDDAFYAAKLATARFYLRRILPETTGLALAIRNGAATIMATDAFS